METSAELDVHMIGSEWFDTIPGGLNRYFEQLFRAMSENPRVSVSASAFGEPIAGGSTLGSIDRPVLSRLIASARAPRLGPASVLDRHFALYGHFDLPQSAGLRVTHFQGPWAGESAAAGAGPLSVRAKWLWEKATYGRSDAFVVLCDRFKDLLVNTYGVDPDTVEVIPPGVDADRFTFTEPDPDSRMILCVRRLERRMGIDVLIRSLSTIRRSIPGATLVIAGTGTYEAELHSLVGKLKLQDAVRFVGRVPDTELTALYSSARVTAVPSLALEGFGLIALESLASGRAPVVTDCGGLPDSVATLDNSLIVPPGEADALAARLIEALDGKGPSALDCRRHAETFSWAAAATRHVEMYKSLL